MMNDIIKIIVVDDHLMVRMGLRRMISTEDLEVIADFPTAHECMAFIQITPPDVVLMDIQMPDTDGIIAMQQIKKFNPSIKVIMITTYGSVLYLLRAMSAGADGFLLKDISREMLHKGIRDVVFGIGDVNHDFVQRVLKELAETNQTEQVHRSLNVQLTSREYSILQLLVEGKSNAFISHILGISSHTVKEYMASINEKLKVSNRTEAAVKAIRYGIVK